MSNQLIVSNQITCNLCRDSIFSQHRHDYVTCKCGNVSVDGGQEYLRRAGEGFIDISIVMDKDDVRVLTASLADSAESGRNYYGLALCALRTLRDLGYKVTKEIL